MSTTEILKVYRLDGHPDNNIYEVDKVIKEKEKIHKFNSKQKDIGLRI